MKPSKVAEKADTCPECGSTNLRHHDCGECEMDWCRDCGVHLSIEGIIYRSMPDVVMSKEER